MATKYRHFGLGLFKPGAHDGAGRMVVAAFLLCVGICARGETVTEEPDAFLEYIEATGENGGKQYIDTGVNAETGLKAQIDFAWASGDISGKDWSFLDATGEHEAAFLLNVAQTAMPVELKIVDVEVVEGGARIRVAAEAGGDGVDLSHANGVIYVAAGDTVTNLVERAVQGTTFSGDGQTATITVPSTVVSPGGKWERF